MRSVLTLALLLGLSICSHAGTPEDSLKVLMNQVRIYDSIESTLHYRTGRIPLEGGMATLNVAPGFKFLEGAEAQKVIEEYWGNPKGTAPLGMIVPATGGAILSDYAFVVTYNAMGFVKDDDAKDIKYGELLEELKKDSEEENEARRKAGLNTMTLLGWAANPYYDEKAKVLYWAKEYAVEGQQDHALNYDVRVLGRKGVLVLQAVGGMDALDSVNAHTRELLGMVTFNEGSRYQDFDSKTDNIAAVTIGGLVAGKVLAKVGFFAVLAKYAKLIFLAIAAAGGALWRFFTGRKKTSDAPMYEEAPQKEEPVV